MFATAFLWLSKPFARTLTLILGGLGLVWGVLAVYGRVVRQQAEAKHRAEQAVLNAATTREVLNAPTHTDTGSALDAIRSDLDRLRR